MRFLPLLFLIPLTHGVYVPNPENADHRAGVAFGYTAADGPATWAATYSTCGGMSQSPINLESATRYNTNLQDFTLTNYDMPMSGVLSIGTGITFSYSSADNAPTVTGGRLGSDVFEFAQFHWHWGSASTQGSEHTLDNKEYPAELHLVHFNKKYGDIGTAVSKADGLAVLGFFYEVSSLDNGNLSPFIDQIATLISKKRSLDQGRAFNFTEEARDLKSKKAGSKSEKTKKLTRSSEAAVSGTIRLDSMLPVGGLPGNYYYYSGSLTTPTCDESVLWTVFDTTNTISESQLAMFRTLTNGGVSLNDNYRPPQPLNGRTVSYRVAPPSSSELTSATFGAAVIGAAVGAAIVLAISGAFSAFLPTLSSRSITQALFPESFNPDILRRLTKRYQN